MNGLGGRLHDEPRAGLAQKLAKLRYLFQLQHTIIWPFEYSPMLAHDKRKLIVPMSLDLAQMLDKFYGMIPTETLQDFSTEKAVA